MVKDVEMKCAALLVDDDPFTRTVLSAVLRELGARLVTSVGTSVAAMQAMNEEMYDVAILDLDLGEGPTGIDVAHGLRRIHPQVAIIILSTYAEPRLLGRRQVSLPTGARFVVKQSISDTSTLERIIHNVLEHPLQHVELAQSLEGVSALSDLQIQIIRLISEGKSNGEIARLVIMEENSVEKAIARIIKKLDVKADRTQNQRVMLAQFYFQITKTAHHIRE